MFDFLQNLFKQKPNMLAGQQDTWNGLRDVGMAAPAAPKPGFLGGYQQFADSNTGRSLNDFFTGMAQGKTMDQSLGMGAAMLSQGRGTRQEKERAKQQMNKTVEWLQGNGLDASQAQMIASQPTVLADYLKQKLKPADPNEALESQFKQAQIDNMRSQIDERNNPNVRDQFGLNPIYGKDEAGNLVVMQPSKSGGLVKANMPEGVSLQPGVDKIDLGTMWGITDRSGSIISTIPKDLAGAEAAKAIGGKQGDAQFDLPRVEQNASQSLGILKRMKEHKGREGSTGFIQGMLPSRTSDQVDFQSLVDQTQGQSFLQAFQMLKGAGQITEIEGTKATDAISRLRNQRLGDEDYVRAIADLEEVITNGVARARQQAGGGAVQPPSPGGANYKSKYGLD